MNKHSLILTISLVVLLAVSAAAGTPNVRYKDIRALGMGGAGIATMNDFSAVMYNPAQLVRAETHIDLINIQANVGKDITDMFSFYDDHKDTFDDWDGATESEQDALLKDMTPFDDNWMGVGAYPQIGISFPNFALGVYGASDVRFKADKSVFADPRAYVDGVADLVFTAGAAMELPVSFVPHKLYGGAAIKIIRRQQIENFKFSADNVELGTVYDSLSEETLTGFGLDVGLLYELMPDIDLGMKITDVIGSIDGDAPPRMINVGAAWHMTPELTFAADFNDMLFTRGENIFNKLYFGAEFTGIPILPLRAGFGQGYPSIGAGLKLGILDLDGAVYGVEFSDHPGGDGDYNYAVRLKIGF
ncbi:MAG: conjugal transfer protein TraF [bacterium]